MSKKSVFITFLALLAVLTSCKTKDPASDEVNIVSQFVYDGLSTYYLWADEM